MVSRMLLLGFAVAHIGEDDLRERFHYVDETMKRLANGAAGVRLMFSDTKYVEVSDLYAFCSFTRKDFWMKPKD
jgi:hypothetical protein